MHGLAVQALAATQRLAVDGNMLGLALFQCKATKGAAQCIGVKRLKEIIIRRMAGGFAGLDAE